MPAEVVTLRKRQIKNLCTLLFLSNGTPMIRAGDEFIQTPHGNSNPYNQDNETTWLDWHRLQRNPDIHRFSGRRLRSGRLIPHWVGAASGATMSCGMA